MHFRQNISGCTMLYLFGCPRTSGGLCQYRVSAAAWWSGLEAAEKRPQIPVSEESRSRGRSRFDCFDSWILQELNKVNQPLETSSCAAAELNSTASTEITTSCSSSVE